MFQWKSDHLKNYVPTSHSLDPRLGQTLQSKEPDWHLVGYPDDEGIKNNNGRTGSSEGPDGFRKVFYKMTPHLLFGQDEVLDLGDLPITDSLHNRHQVLKAELTKLHQSNKKIISIGGGHDYGYPDAAAFCEHFISLGERPFVINFDAHLDVRPLEDKITSGTPFYRLLSEVGQKIDFVEIGIQPHCNSKAHLDWATSNGAMVYHRSEIETLGLFKIITNLAHQFEDRPALISIDIDAFSSIEAPGCSQSWTTGFKFHEFLPALKLIKRRLNVRHLGLYELSPPLDVGLMTQRLASQIIFEFLTWDDPESSSES